MNGEDRYTLGMMFKTAMQTELMYKSVYWHKEQRNTRTDGGMVITCVFQSVSRGISGSAPQVPYISNLLGSKHEILIRKDKSEGTDTRVSSFLLC